MNNSEGTDNAYTSLCAALATRNLYIYIYALVDTV